MSVSSDGRRRLMNRRTLAVAAAVVVGLVVALLFVWNKDTPAPAALRPGCLIGGQQPCSDDVEPGRAYRFQVLHCGLVWVVDFDGSYWDVDTTTMTDEENGRFGINSDEGTMTLEQSNVAVYRSDRGGQATLHRHDGPKTFFNCG